MATIKSYTDIEQSKKLAKILPHESADMVIWGRDLDLVSATNAQKFMSGLKDRKMNYIPCWSLSALLGVLPNGLRMKKFSQKKGKYSLYSFTSIFIEFYIESDNPVDACVVIIDKLHDLKIL